MTSHADDVFQVDVLVMSCKVLLGVIGILNGGASLQATWTKVLGHNADKKRVHTRSYVHRRYVEQAEDTPEVASTYDDIGRWKEMLLVSLIWRAFPHEQWAPTFLLHLTL